MKKNYNCPAKNKHIKGNSYKSNGSGEEYRKRRAKAQTRL